MKLPGEEISFILCALLPAGDKDPVYKARCAGHAPVMEGVKNE